MHEHAISVLFLPRALIIIYVYSRLHFLHLSFAYSYVCKMVHVLYRSPCRGSHPKTILESFCVSEKLALCYGCSSKRMNQSDLGGLSGSSDSSTLAPYVVDAQTTQLANSWSSSAKGSTASASPSPMPMPMPMPLHYVNCSSPFQKHYARLEMSKALANLWLAPRGAENLLSAYAELGWRAPVMRQGVERLLTGSAAAVDECDTGSDEHKAFSPIGRVDNYEVLADLTTSFSLLLSFMFVALSGAPFARLTSRSLLLSSILFYILYFRLSSLQHYHFKQCSHLQVSCLIHNILLLTCVTLLVLC